MRWLVVLLLLIPLSIVYAAPADTEFQKVISTHGMWSVIINFTDVSNPMCQVKGIAMTVDEQYAGPVTVWKEKYQGGKTPVAEVGLFMLTGTKIPINLKNDPGIHTLMIQKMGVKGVRRDASAHMALFNISSGMLQAMAETQIAIASLFDVQGKEYDLLILMDGFKQAWNSCD